MEINVQYRCMPSSKAGLLEIQVLWNVLLCRLEISFVMAISPPFSQVMYLTPKYSHQVPNYSQQDAPYLDLFIFTDALHVSGGSSTHHQERVSVYTASGIVNEYCCWLLPWER